jgi:hypothetical protein
MLGGQLVQAQQGGRRIGTAGKSHQNPVARLQHAMGRYRFLDGPDQRIAGWIAIRPHGNNQTFGKLRLTAASANVG